MGLLGRIAVLFAALLTAPAFAQDNGPIAIIGADILPMTATERLRDQTVIVAGDRIVSIGPRASTPVPNGARRIEARGMTLMPGLVDMHVHIAPTPGAPGDAAHRAMAVMLGYGVTTARGMVGSPNNLAVREAIERGTLPGPRFYVAAPGLSTNNTATPDAARAAVTAAREAGYDFMKVFSLDLASWEALHESARAANLPVAGHVPNAVGMDRAAAAGQQIEHLDASLFALLPDGSPARAIEFGQFPPQAVMAALGNVSDADLDALARRMRAANSWHVPTLALFGGFTDMTTPVATLRALPAMRYVPDAVLAQWADQRTQFREQSGWTAAHAESFIALRRRIARAFHRAGVPMMPGSDSAQQFTIWGEGLLAEIAALHDAGLSRMDALRAATVVPRDYFRSRSNGGSALGWRADFGTVETGTRADLLLLRGDPGQDLANLRQVETVIAGGRLYDRATLTRMLDDASRAAKAVN